MSEMLEVIVKQSGLEQSKAQFILQTFSGYFALADEWERRAKTIIVTDGEQKDLIAMARIGRLALREKRIALESARKSLKEQAIREGKAIDGIAKVLKALIVPIEEYLDKQEHFVEYKKAEDDRLAKIEAEQKAEAERVAAEQARIDEQRRIAAENARLKAEAEALEQKMEREREQAEQARIAAERKLEKARQEAALAAAKAKQEAEAARLAAERKANDEAQKHAAEIEKIRAEKESIRVAAERKALEDKKKADEIAAKAKQKADSERAFAEAEKRKAEYARARAEAALIEGKRALEEQLRKTITCPNCGTRIDISKAEAL